MRITLPLTIGISVLSCARQLPTATKSTSSQTQSSTDRFNCDRDVSNCVLTGGELDQPKGIHATWEVTYDFPCFQSGRTVISTIEIQSGSDSKRLVYGARNTVIEVSSASSLQIIDTNPGNTMSQGSFDWNTGCALSLKWTARPSVLQISNWTNEVRQIKQGIQDNLDLYASRRDVETFLDIYLQNPSPETKSILSRTIDELRASGREIDKVKADQLQLILDNQPRELILAPYLAARNKIETVYMPQADQLLEILNPWGVELHLELNQILDSAKDALH